MKVTFIDGFGAFVNAGDTFAVLTSDQALTGSFDNVVSGQRLTTQDGLGSFLVRYGTGSPTPNAVTLSAFVATPEPTGLGLLALGAMGILRRRRR